MLGLENAIWDDGEWVSWDEINRQIQYKEWRAKYPNADLSVVEDFEAVMSFAEGYNHRTGRHLNIYGDIGELFAVITLGLKLHRNYAQGSDGRLGDDFIEVKTIAPFKQKPKVRVRLDRNFSKLFVARVTPDFEIAARMIDRKDLPAARGKWAEIHWDDLPKSDPRQT